MKFNACTTAVLALLLAGALTSNAQRDYKDQSMDLLRLLASKPWYNGPYGRWEPRPTEMDSSLPLDDADDEFKTSSKRSAVATALNSGRRRRQPAPALGVLNDVGSFFDSLRDNLETLTSLTPEQRSTLFQGPPSVVSAPSSDLTTADRSWRPTGTQMQTDTTQGCCGPAWDARRSPFPHPLARIRFSRNTRDKMDIYNMDADTLPAVYKLPRPSSILFPEYFIAYENLDPPVLSDDPFETQRNEAHNFNSIPYVPLDSELGRSLLLQYFGYGFPKQKDDVDKVESANDQSVNGDDNEVECQTHKARCPRHRRGACNHL